MDEELLAQEIRREATVIQYVILILPFVCCCCCFISLCLFLRSHNILGVWLIILILSDCIFNIAIIHPISSITFSSPFHFPAFLWMCSYGACTKKQPYCLVTSLYPRYLFSNIYIFFFCILFFILNYPLLFFFHYFLILFIYYPFLSLFYHDLFYLSYYFLFSLCV